VSKKNEAAEVQPAVTADVAIRSVNVGGRDVQSVNEMNVLMSSVTGVAEMSGDLGSSVIIRELTAERDRIRRTELPKVAKVLELHRETLGKALEKEKKEAEAAVKKAAEDVREKLVSAKLPCVVDRIDVEQDAEGVVSATYRLDEDCKAGDYANIDISIRRSWEIQPGKEVADALAAVKEAKLAVHAVEQEIYRLNEQLSPARRDELRCGMKATATKNLMLNAGMDAVVQSVEQAAAEQAKLLIASLK